MIITLEIPQSIEADVLLAFSVNENENVKADESLVKNKLQEHVLNVYRSYIIDRGATLAREAINQQVELIKDSVVTEEKTYKPEPIAEPLPVVDNGGNK